MFSIPQKLSSPFGLLGDDAKLAFRSQSGGILRLADPRLIPATDIAYWSQYTTLFDSASDVYSLISPHDIRRALIESPGNVATLVRFLTSKIQTLLSDHTFPSTPSAIVLASSFIGASSNERSTTKELLNCIRVLQRVLPVIIENEALAGFEDELFWKREAAPPPTNSVEPEQPQFVIEDEDDEQGPAASAATTITSQTPKPTQMLPSLAEKLISALVDLLFCCGFTLPAKLQVDHYKINYVIWEKGVGSTAAIPPARDLDANRVEILRLLLVLLSPQIYRPASVLLSSPSKYTVHLVQVLPRKHVLALLCSLLNTAMNAPHAAGFQLPYNHLVWKGEDAHLSLVGMSLQVLCIVLDYQAATARDVGPAGTATPADDPSPSPTSKTNAFRYFASKIHRTADFEFVLSGILGILQQQVSATSGTVLPGSKKEVPYVVETFILLWKMIELNKKFRTYLLQSDKAVSILAYLLCFCLELKDKPQYHGLCRALTYIVQSLSAEPSFGAQLASPIKVALPAKWNTMGTAADFMITAIYSIVATTSGQFNSLYPALIIALSNSAPYFVNLGVTASTRLIQLLVSFANPPFLLSDEGHPRLVFFMLEVLNSIIQHNLASNPNVTYAILRHHNTFQNLATFTLGAGLREIRRIQLAKEEMERNPQSNKGKARASDDDGFVPAEEKARLLKLEQEREEYEQFELGDVGEEDVEEDEPLRHAAMAEESQRDLEAQVEAVPGVGMQIVDDPLSRPIPPYKPTRTRSTPPAPLSRQHSRTSTSSSATPLSEKARGKQRQASISGALVSPTARDGGELGLTSSLEMIAAAGIGRNGFVPTQEWVTSWQQGLPLDTVLITISELLPKVQDLQTSLNRPNTSPAILDFLKTVTLQHVLPAPPTLTTRRFQWSDASLVWLTSLIWGEVYVRNMSPLGIWNNTNVRLFYVKHAQPVAGGGNQITAAVSNVMGGFLGRGGPGNGNGGVVTASIGAPQTGPRNGGR